MNDLRFALRQLLKNPSFTAVAVLTLALGIGATTAIFSVIYGVLINPYPYSKPSEIWAPGVRSVKSQQVMRPYRRSELEAMAALPAFSLVMGTSPGRALLSGDHALEEVTAPRLTSNAFQFIGVPPLLGRAFGPSDFPSAGAPELVTVISFQLWQRLFSGDPNVLGQRLRLDDQSYSVIGVMPPRFGWWTSDGLWLPLADVPGDPGRVFPLGRLRPGADASVARQQLHSLQLELARLNPEGFPKESFESTLTNYLDMTVASGEMHRTLQLLFGAVGFLLLIACSNVANLQLARATSRMREMAIRLSIGATRGRLVRQLLTESVLISGLGGALGLAFSMMMTHLMVVLMPGFNVPSEARIEVNGYVLAFCTAVSLLTGAVFGLVPALQSTRPNLAGALKDDRGADGGSIRGDGFRAGLVVVEVGLAIVLLVSAGLTIRSFLALQQVDPGFRAENVVTVDVMLPRAAYSSADSRNRFAQELLDRIEKIPGVRSAQIGNGGAPFGGPQSGFSIHGQAGAESQTVTLDLVSADYLKTLGIALRRGRMLDAGEVRRGDRFAVINEATAKLWPAGEDPLGRQIRLDLLKTGAGPAGVPTNATSEVTVIGIFADTRNNGLTSATRPTALVPFTLLAPPGRTLVIRTQNEPSAILGSVRSVIRSIDSQLPVRNVRTLAEAVATQTVQPRFTMTLFSLFAGAGLLLATVGLYSVLSFLVSRRTREIGVRMALGAQRRDVLTLVLRDGGRLVGLGIVAGTLASLGAARWVQSQVDLFHVTPTDPVSFLSVILLLSLVALVACWIPARRAASVNPMEALRAGD